MITAKNILYTILLIILVYGQKRLCHFLFQFTDSVVSVYGCLKLDAQNNSYHKVPTKSFQ
jgi:hypothetical protein